MKPIDLSGKNFDKALGFYRPQPILKFQVANFSRLNVIDLKPFFIALRTTKNRRK